MVEIKSLNTGIHSCTETIMGLVDCPGERCKGKQIFIEVKNLGDHPDTARIIAHKPPGGGEWCSYSGKCINESN